MSEILTRQTQQFRRLTADGKLVIVEQIPDGSDAHLRLTVVDHAAGVAEATTFEVNLIAWTDVLNWLLELRRDAR